MARRKKLPDAEASRRARAIIDCLDAMLAEEPPEVTNWAFLHLHFDKRNEEARFHEKLAKLKDSWRKIESPLTERGRRHHDGSVNGGGRRRDDAERQRQLTQETLLRFATDQPGLTRKVLVQRVAKYLGINRSTVYRHIS